MRTVQLIAVAVSVAVLAACSSGSDRSADQPDAAAPSSVVAPVTAVRPVTTTVPDSIVPASSAPDSTDSVPMVKPDEPLNTEDLVPFSDVPKIEQAPLVELEGGGGIFAYYDIGFDEFLAAQKAVLLAAGWVLTTDFSDATGWVFVAEKGDARISGGLARCGVEVDAGDGSTVEVCGLSRPELAGLNVKVQFNIIQS
jgi:hypothetical protein